jgi:hypothetical protein
MTSRSTYESTVKSAGQTQIATVVAAVGTAQTTADASNSVVGYNNATGNNGNLVAALKAAAIAKAAALFAAEQTRQATVAVARDTLRATGDVGPV